jgi:CHASE3 domain sensor protein
MKNLKIRTKLLILAAFAIGILIANGLIFYYAINYLNRLNSLKSSMQTLSELTLELRKNEKDFLMRESKNETYFKSSESTYLKNFNEEIKSVFALLDSGRQNSLLQESNLQQDIILLTKDFKTYQGSFAEIQSAIFDRGFKNYGIEGIFRRNAHALDSVFEAKK